MIESDYLDFPNYIRIQQNVKEKSSLEYTEEDFSPKLQIILARVEML